MARSIVSREILALALLVWTPQEAAKVEEATRPLSPADLARIEAVFEAHNRTRAEYERPPLTRDPKLDAAAQAHARDMAAREVMSHEGGDGSTPAQRIDRTNYPYRLVGENVAAGQRTADAVMGAWMDSPGHKKNILGTYEQIGIGLAYSSTGRPYWAVSFGTPWPRLDPSGSLAELLELVNAERKKAKKPPLRRNSKLDAVAKSRVTALAAAEPERVGDDSQGRFVRDLKNSGYAYRRVGEMAAGGLATPRDLLDAFLEDEDQKKTLLGDYAEIGLGLAHGEREAPYWELVLGTPAR